MELGDYKIEDLIQLRRRIDDELRARHRADQTHTEHELRGSAEKWGYALTEVLAGISPEYERRAMRARYQHPYDPNRVWTGAGHKPEWVRQWEASGHSIEELRIGGH